MAKTIASGFLSDNQFHLDYLVENEEYTTLKNRITDELISQVEINGFRKGKAPREKALEHINPQTLGQKVIQTVLDEHSPAAVQATNNELKKHDRLVAGLELDYDLKHTSETENGGFKMRILAHLLPAIDLKKVDSLTIEQPKKEDITDLPEYTLFHQQEITKLLNEQNDFTPAEEGEEIKEGLVAVVDMHGTVDGKEVEGLHSHGMQVLVGSGNFLPVFEENLKGLKKGDTKEFDLPFPESYVTELAGKTAQVSIQVTEIMSPKYQTIAELLEGKENLKNVYKDEQAIHDDIQNVYTARIEQVLDNIRRKRVVESLLQAIPDFPMDDQLINQETDRIFNSLLQDAATKNLTEAQALIQAGISAKKIEELNKLDKDGVKHEVEQYVRNEVKLTNILSTIYQIRVDKKPTQEEFEATIKDAVDNKQKYNIEASADENRVRNIINDRIIRQASGNYLLEVAMKNAKK